MRAKILVVDDEPMIRKLVGTILQSGGYDVFCAEGPETALAVLDQQPDLDLLLTDMIMPRMNGSKLAQVLSSRKPGLRVLFMSGFAPESCAPLSGGCDSEYLHKPFRVTELLTKVKGMLN